MSVPFNSQHGLIVVPAVLEGPLGSIDLLLVLDSGATTSVVSAGMLTLVGYDPALAPQQVQMTTASGVEFVPRLPVSRLKALEQERTALPVLAHTLPPGANVDGLLGLDFMRGMVLKIDYRQGQISLQ